MSIEETAPQKRKALNQLTIALAVMVVVAAVVFGVTVFSGSSGPKTLAASYQCVPGPLIPQLKAGESGSMSTTYGTFTATYRATMSASAAANGLHGTPFDGTLTVTNGSTTWTLAKPDNGSVSQINEMCVIAFSPEVDPGVMIEGFTGGAHCCETPVIYLFDRAENRYVKVVDMSPIDFENPHAFDTNVGFIPKVVGDKVLLQTGDDAFDYTFGCYACGVDPIVLDSVSFHGLTDVTLQEPALVAADARADWKYVQESVKAEGSTSAKVIPYPFGFLAPWVADECALGHGASAWSKVEQLSRQGKISNALYYTATMTHRSFVPYLRSFLLKDDDCTGQI
ncbi:MAG: hypothetical protein WCF25_13135 [Acidimicrobiales bacterium]